MGAVPGGANVGRDIGHLRGAPCRQDDLMAVLGKDMRERGAYPGGGAGDQGRGPCVRR